VFESPRWLPDGRGLVGLIREQSSNFTISQIGYVSYPEGKISGVTHDTNNYTDLSVTANGQVMGAVLGEGRWNLYVVPSNGPASEAKAVAPADAFTGFPWMPDGHLVADQANTLHWIDPVTRAKTPIPTEEGKPSGNPSACAGRYLVFELGFHAGTGDNNIWRIDASGGNLKQLTTGTQDTRAECSPDGRWVYYISQREEANLARVPVDGGTPQVVSDLPISANFDLDPDGKTAAFATLEHSGEHKERLVMVPTEPGRPPRILDFERYRFGLLRFSADGKAVVYPTRENGVDNLWLQPLDGSKGHAITDFKSERIYDFRWSLDGKQLALLRGHTDADVVLIRSQQP
jgi:Tol biopolymer transport system component